MEESGLERLLSPRSIAVVGASPTLDRAPMRIFDNLIAGGYDGSVFPVNPKYDEVFGFRCFASLSALPEVPDVVAVSVAWHRLLDVLEEAAGLGVPAALIYGATYNEPGVDVDQMEKAISDLAKRSGMRILGPSTQGSFRVASKACLSWSAAYSGANLAESGPIGWVSQSGAIGTALLGLIRDLGVGLSHWVSTGNETDLEFSEIASHVLDDPATTALCGYIESIRDLTAFRAMTAKAQALGKPVVLIKGGLSAAGSAAAASHTGALASSSAVFEGLFRQCGVIVASDLDELAMIAWMLQHKPNIQSGNHAAVLCNSGGLGIVLADVADRQGFEVDQLSDGHREALRPLLPSYVVAGNPVDMPVVMMRRPGDLPGILEVLSNDTEFDVFILVVLGVSPAAAYDLPKVFEAIQAADRVAGGRLVPILFAGSSDIIGQAHSAGVEAISDAPRAIAALSKIMGARKSEPEQVQTEEAGSSDLYRLSEADAKKLLGTHGIPVPAGEVVASAAEAGDAADRLGYPLVVKVSSPDIVHKTDVDGVRLKLSSRDAVTRAVDEILESVGQHMPGAQLDGCLLEPMAGDGIDVIIGMHRDPALGPVMMFGLGGVNVELFGDASFRVPPLDADTAREMIGETRAVKLLSGWRGAAQADIDALLDIMVRTSEFVESKASALAEFELNPVRVHDKGSGVTVLDAVCAFDKAPDGAVRDT